MASTQQTRKSLSLMLTDILGDLGVNEEILSRKREFALILESLNHEPMVKSSGNSFHFIGGLSDGSATYSMVSDDRLLICKPTYHVIQKLNDWKSDFMTLLIVHDDALPPRYCRLQLLDDNAPRAATCIPNDQFVIDSTGRILLKNTSFETSNLDEEFGPTTMDMDFHVDVHTTLHCKDWPIQKTLKWLNRKRVSEWPNRELKLKCMETGFFVGPVSRVDRIYVEDTEWKICFSHAEMHLMFSLNTTQICCYVLIKILLRSHVHRGLPDDIRITSYMCKTVLFYCIEENALDVWQEHQLIYCLTLVLQKLHTCVLEDNCPHYFIAEDNLFRNMLWCLRERQQVLKNIQHIITNIDTVLFELEIDDIGAKLRQSMTTESMTTESMTTEPMTTESMTTESVTTESMTTESMTTESVTTESMTTESMTTEPMTTEPMTTESVTTESMTTESMTTESMTTESVTREFQTLHHDTDSVDDDVKNYDFSVADIVRRSLRLLEWSTVVYDWICDV